MAKQLTAPAVHRLKPGKQRREIPDRGSPGLYLVIQVSGHKSWALRFRRPSGKSGKLTLGPVDLSGRESADKPVIGAPLTLASARVLAAEINHQRATGVDVVAIKHRERLVREMGDAKTFGQAALDFMQQHAMRKTRRWRAQARLLGLRVVVTDGQPPELQPIPKGLVDRWRDDPITTIDGDTIHALVREVREKGTPGSNRRAKGPTDGIARATFSALNTMFDWLVKERRLRLNPCVGVHAPAKPKSRKRVLSNTEIVKFWAACDKVGPPIGQAFKLLLLTGCRLNEVFGMRRSELSEDGRTWTIPGERTKNHLDHVVPLPPMARDLLASVGITSHLAFTINGKTPVACGMRPRSRLIAETKIPPWHLHDLRRTAATGMAEIGIAPHIVEACLNHISGAKAGVAGIYNKAAYLPEKKATFERWAAHIEGLLEGRAANVVPLHKADVS